MRRVVHLALFVKSRSALNKSLGGYILFLYVVTAKGVHPQALSTVPLFHILSDCVEHTR